MNRREKRKGEVREMGCGSSKSVDAAAVAYRPSPTSFAVFDINAIEEPWLKQLNNSKPLYQQKPSIPDPILQKLNMVDATATEAPKSWDEVSKTLEDIRPVIGKPEAEAVEAPRESKVFHTVEEVEAKLKSNGNKLKENIFIVRDRLQLERQKESKLKRDNPLREFPEKCPAGGREKVVVYTTSLGGVRKTFEECKQVREVLEGHRVVLDERDVSLHGGFLREVKDLLGEGVSLPRVFVKGRYLGGFEELLQLNETGRLRRILDATRVDRAILPRQPCEGCGGARFVPCLNCSGSCKVFLTPLQPQTCPICNENGLVQCPACI